MACGLAGCGSNGGGPSAGPGAWKQVDAQLVNGIDIIAVGSRLLAGGYDGLFVSDDDGATWSKEAGAPPIGTMTDLVVVGTSVLAATEQGLYVSTDQGTSFAPVAAAGLPTSVGIYTSIVVGNDLLVGMNAASQDPGISGGLFRTSDGGAIFTSSSSGLPQDQAIPDFAIAGGTVYCVAITGVGQSTDGGANWVLNALPTTSNVLSIATVNGTVLGGTADGILYTSPDGVNWSLSGDGLPPGEPIDVLFADGGQAWSSSPGSAGTSSGVYVSSDAGASWTALNDGFAAVPPYVVAFAVLDGYLVGVTESDGIWRRPL
jgi:hypothetical protein